MKTKWNALGAAIMLLFGVVVFCASGFAQDFQRNYRVAPNGSIRVFTVSGDVKVQGYDGAEIVVQGSKVGRNPERVEIVDRSSADHVDVGVRYPERSGGDASVNFVVKVPRAVTYNFTDIYSVSGSVYFADVTGNIKAHSVSGSVEMKNVSGIISAESVSGNVDVYLKKVEGEGDMRFSSVSGNVAVRAPADLSAYVVMSTTIGALTTDFPVEIQERRYAPGRSARGRLGSGACSIRITSVSGRVSLTKG